MVIEWRLLSLELPLFNLRAFVEPVRYIIRF